MVAYGLTMSLKIKHNSVTGFSIHSLQLIVNIGNIYFTLLFEVVFTKPYFGCKYHLYYRFGWRFVNPGVREFCFTSMKE